MAAPGTLKRRMTEINKKTAKLADLLTKTTAQAALLRQIESLEKERDGIGLKLASMESERTAMKACAEITPDTVRKLLRTILTELNDYPDRLRDAIHQLIDRVELSPETSRRCRNTASARSLKAANWWRPHGDSNPGTYRERVVSWASRRWGPGKNLLSTCWWRYAGSNRGPLACHASALPAELYPLERRANYRGAVDACKAKGFSRSGCQLCHQLLPRPLPSHIRRRSLANGGDFVPAGVY